MYLLAQINQFGHCSSPDFHSNGIHFLEWWWISENLKVNSITCLLLKCIEKRRQKTYVIFLAIFNLFYYRYFIFHISIVAIVTHLMFCEDFSQLKKKDRCFWYLTFSIRSFVWNHSVSIGLNVQSSTFQSAENQLEMKEHFI